MKKILLTFIISILFLTASCSYNTVTADIWLMDTYCTVTLYGTADSNAEKIITETLTECEKDILLKNDSKSFFAEGIENTVPIKNDIHDMLEICLHISDISDGAFDITVAPLTQLWDIQNRLEPPSKTEIEEAKKTVGSENIILEEEKIILLTKGCGIDLGAVGKGYVGDKTAEILKEHGYEAGLLNLGGNVTVFGNNPKREDGGFLIGIKDPFILSDIYASVKVSDTNVVTAGGYERYFEYEGERYHHIIDPQTGYPANNGTASVTVICSNGIVADALATAIYVSGHEKGLEILNTLRDDYNDVAALILLENGDLITYNISGYGLSTYNFEGKIYYHD